MAKYLLHKIELVNGKSQKIFKLEINGVCKFDEFCAMLIKNGNSKANIGSIYATIESLDKEKRLPSNKVKLLKRDKGDPTPDYRIRSGDYRIYYFRDISGNVIVLGGNKKTQVKDIVKFRKIKKSYIKETKV